MTLPRHPALVPLDEASSLAKRSGVTGASLLLLSKAGVAVAPTWVLDAGAFRDAAGRPPVDAEPKALLKKTSGRSELAARVREAMLHVVLPEPLSVALRALGEELLASGNGITVRRNPTVLLPHELELCRASARFLTHVDELEPAVRLVWAETYFESTLLAAASLGHKTLSMAVLISPGDLRGGAVEDRSEAPFLRVWSGAKGVAAASEIPIAPPKVELQLPVQTAMSRSVAAPWLEEVTRAFTACFDADAADDHRFVRQVPGGLALAGGPVRDALADALPASVAAWFAVDPPLARPSVSSLRSSVGALTHRRKLADLERAVEELKLVARARREADVEIDLSILPDDGLVPSLREPLAMLTAVARLQGRVLAEALLAQGRLADGLAPHLRGRTADVALSLATSSVWASPLRGLVEVAEAARTDPASREALSRGDAPSGLAARLFARFLTEHGDLPFDALELSRGALRDEPAVALAMLRALVSSEGRLAGVREVSLGPLGRIARPVVLGLRGQATLAWSLVAELSRLAFGALASIREAVREAGCRLARMDPSLAADAAFPTAIDELIAALKTGDPRLGAVVAWRLADPGPGAWDPRDGSVRGVAPGTATGTLRVLDDPADAWRVGSGDLVLFPASSPALSPLLATAGGAVLVGGHALSPVAFAARAVGVPAVTVPEGFRARDGDVVRLDGARGRLELA